MIINKFFAEFVYKNSGGKRNAIYVATLLNGLCMGIIMYSLTVGLEDYSANNVVSLRALLMFGLSLAAYYFTQKLGGQIVSAAVLKGLGDLELRVMDKLRRADYETYNEINTELVYATVGGDKYGAVMAARFLIPTMSAMIVVVLTVLYMCTVSMPGAMLVALTFVLLIRIRGTLDGTISRRKAKDATATDNFTMSLKDIVEGFNELKINRRKSEALFTKKITSASKEKNIRLIGTEIYQMSSIVLEQATLFLPLGLTLFVLPTLFNTPTADLVRIISVTLVVIWPAYTLVQFGPVSAAAADIVKRLTNLESRLDKANLEKVIKNEDDYPLAPQFSNLLCNAIEFAYPKRQGDEKVFSLKIDNFYINKGELVIMSGGNGSGKSTFMRILAGLVQPTAGCIQVDGVNQSLIGQANYRAMLSLIMTDFHLFDELYGVDNTDETQFNKWVNKLGMQSKVTYGQKLPTENLSSGQKKRMALLAAILEDRQIMLLDEVAADFDPYFRELYYRDILPELKSEGRTLFVISHDDRYYDIADRILRMSEGSIVEDYTP